jgi:hypothetical protein
VLALMSTPKRRVSVRLVTNATSKEVVVMIRNMGVVDRGFRVFVVAPAAITVAFLLGAGTLGGVILFVFAGLMLATAVTAFCPTYTVIGISTLHGPHRAGHGLWAGHA